MCASGLPTDKDDNAVIAVNAALDMMEFMNGFNTIKKIQNLPAFELRIGINTGPVVAGVVGITKFAYDIWGDTVNLASRLEHKSEPGKINISEATWSLIKDDFDCNFRGKIAVKSKGEIDMYFVERKTKTQFAAGEK
jgi:class 3 adenylate cyclase